MDNIINTIKELQGITSQRTRFYTEINITSEFFSINQKLLYIKDISIDGDYLFIFTDNNSYKLKISDDLSISYVCNEPIIDEKDNIRLRIKQKRIG